MRATLEKLDACEEAIEWAGDKSPKKVWDTCERGDWMLWLACRLDVDRKLLVKAACACARQALVRVPAGEKRPRIAIETAEQWTEDMATLREVSRATVAAYTAAHEAYTAAHEAYVADAARAAYAASSCYAAAHAANSVSYANDASAVPITVANNAHAYFTVDAARSKSLAASADIVRGIINCKVVTKLWR